MQTGTLTPGDRAWVYWRHAIEGCRIQALHEGTVIVRLDHETQDRVFDESAIVGGWWHIWAEVILRQGRRVWRARHTETYEKPGAITLERPDMLVRYLKALDLLELDMKRQRDEAIRAFEEGRR
jgi:hypothetical protein